MDKKRIAVIQPNIGIIYRGDETFFIQIVKYLSQYYEIDVYTVGVDESIKEHIVSVDCKMDGLLLKYLQIYEKSDFLKWLLNRSRYFLCLQPRVIYCKKFAKKVYKEYLSKEKYDLLFPGMGAEGTGMAGRYRKKHGTPVIYTGGGGIGPSEWRVLMTKPDKYICISSKHLGWAKKFWENCCYIPNGTFVNEFQETKCEQKYFINKGNKLVISVGHLDKDFKRHHLTINAVSHLKNVDLLILGQGEAEEEFRKLAEEKMPGRFEIKSVKRNEIPYFYRSADLFVLPSLDEPFGIVYIEGMAAGLPVVATKDEVRQEIIGEAGILCDVVKEEEYVAAIENALSKEWGDAPIRQAQKFDYNIIGEQYHQLIEELISKYPYHA